MWDLYSLQGKIMLRKGVILTNGLHLCEKEMGLPSPIMQRSKNILQLRYTRPIHPLNLGNVLDLSRIVWRPLLMRQHWRLIFLKFRKQMAKYDLCLEEKECDWENIIMFYCINWAKRRKRWRNLRNKVEIVIQNSDELDQEISLSGIFWGTVLLN